MKLRLRVVMEVGPMTPTAEADVFFDLRAENGAVVCDITKIELVGSVVPDAVVNPIKGYLGRQVSKAVTDAISSLPNAVEHLKKVEIVEISS